MTNKRNGTIPFEPNPNAYNSNQTHTIYHTTKPYSLPRTYHGNILHEADGGVH